MEDNRVIRIAEVLCRIIQGLLIGFGLLYTLVLIHWHFSPEAYRLVDVSNVLKAGISGRGFRVLTDSDAASTPGIVLLGNLDNPTVYWIYFRDLLLMGLTYLIIQWVRKILNSIRSLETFRTGNTTAFRKIGQYAIGLLILGSFNFWRLEGQWNFQLAKTLGPLLLVLGAFVMAEVFQEGNKLMEDRAEK